MSSLAFRVCSDITFRGSRDQPSAKKRWEIVIKAAVLAVVGCRFCEGRNSETTYPNEPFEADVISMCGMSGRSAYIGAINTRTAAFSLAHIE